MGLILLGFALLILPARTAMAQLPGQVMVDPDNPMWLVTNEDLDNNGHPDPIFICGPGGPENFLYRGERLFDGTRNGDQNTLISNMKARGVNSIRFQVIRSHGGEGDETQNPYLQSEPKSNTLDTRILDQWDTWLNALDEAGIVIHFFFYDDGAKIWEDNDLAGMMAEENLITTLVNRYKHLRHLVWGVAEEYSTAYSAERVSRIAALISIIDDNNHPIAGNQVHGLEFDHASDPNLDRFAITYDNTTRVGLHTGMVTAWTNAAGRYGITLYDSINHGLAHRTIVRRKNWAIATGGAYVLVSEMDGSEVFNEKMGDCATLIGFFEGTDFNTMAPHDELGNLGTWLLADPGGSYIAYRDVLGDPFNPTDFIISGMTAGTYLLRWLDPLSGETVEERQLLPAGSNNFLRPEGFGQETAVWIKNLADVPLLRRPVVAPFLLLLQNS